MSNPTLHIDNSDLRMAPVEPVNPNNESPLAHHDLRIAAVPPDISQSGQIAVPADAIPPITAQGAIENSPAFRKAAKTAFDEAVSATVRTGNPTEGEFVVNDSGNPSRITLNATPLGTDAGGAQTVYNDDMAAFHTHPPMPGFNQRPSPADIAAAKKLGKPIMVESSKGLFEVIPGTGEVVQVFSGTDWTKIKKSRKQTK